MLRRIEGYKVNQGKTNTLCTCTQPTNAVYFAVPSAVWAILETSTINIAIGEMYFQHNSQKMFGLFPVMYSISFAILLNFMKTIMKEKNYL